MLCVLGFWPEMSWKSSSSDSSSTRIITSQSSPTWNIFCKGNKLSNIGRRKGQRGKAQQLGVQTIRGPECHWCCFHERRDGVFGQQSKQQQQQAIIRPPVTMRATHHHRGERGGLEQTAQKVHLTNKNELRSILFTTTGSFFRLTPPKYKPI